MRRRRRRRPAPIAVAVVGTLVVLAAAIYLLAYLVAGDKLPKNAQISGVAVGGLPRAAAIDKLTTELGPRAAAPIDVTVNDRTSQVAAGRGRPDRRLRGQRRCGRRWPEPRSAADPPGADRRFGDQCGGAGRRGEAVRCRAGPCGGVRPAARRRCSGVQEDQDSPDRGPARRHPADRGRGHGARGQLSWSTPARFRCRLTWCQPEITDEEADQVVENFAEPAVSAPIKVKAGGAGSFKITPEMIAGSITFAPKNGTLEPVLDADKLRSNADAAGEERRADQAEERHRPAGQRQAEGDPGGQRHRRVGRGPEEGGRAGADRVRQRAHGQRRAHRGQGQVLHRGRQEARHQAR